MRFWIRINQDDEDQEDLEEEENHKDINKSCLGRALQSFHRTNILLGISLGIFLIVGKYILNGYFRTNQLLNWPNPRSDDTLKQKSLNSSDSIIPVIRLPKGNCLTVLVFSQIHNPEVEYNPTIGCTTNSWMQLHSNAHDSYQGALKSGALQ